MSTLSRRSTRTERLTPANTVSRSSDVVPPSKATTGLSGSSETKVMRPKAMAVVNRIATCGVRRTACTLDREGGSTPCLLMPYNRRLAISMLISAELATANMEMNGSKSAMGKSGAAVCTTVANGVSLEASRPTGTTATAQTDTRT
ncbi:hypothetical protein SHIRM173S_01212 [Streptomyces hirsutus]